MVPNFVDRMRGSKWLRALPGHCPGCQIMSLPFLYNEAARGHELARAKEGK